MSTAYLGHRLCNILVTDEPQTFDISTPSGTWKFQRYMHYTQSREAIVSNGACAITYDVSTEVANSGSRAEAMDVRHDELLPICLGASYLTAMTVRPVQDLPSSEIMIMAAGDHFPRERAMRPSFSFVTSSTDFTEDLETFVAQYALVEQKKARLLIHHWLDAMAFWSMEDLILSTATVLEIIAATAEEHGKRHSKKLSTFNTRINYAADRFGLSHLNLEFRRMRNDLVHQGHLLGKQSLRRDKESCSALIAEALNWIDQYVCAIFRLNSSVRNRFDKHTFRTINAFSLG